MTFGILWTFVHPTFRTKIFNPYNIPWPQSCGVAINETLKIGAPGTRWRTPLPMPDPGWVECGKDHLPSLGV